MINKIIMFFTLLGSIIFFSYRKGKKDEGISNFKEMLEENKKTNKLKNDLESINSNELINYHNKLHQKNNNK